jgi:hypothetical protein
VRFRGVSDPADGSRPAAFEHWASRETAARDARATYLSRQVVWGARFLAVFVFVTMIVGWPIGVIWGNGGLQGLSFARIMPFSALMFAFVVPPILWLIGYIVDNMAAMSRAASAIAAAAADMLEPSETAVRNVQTVGGVVRGEVEALNAGIDDALIRLASVEAMIRQHVEAIEYAGATVETRATSAAERVAAERARLMDLTETLNKRADDFATAIAQKAQANLDSFSLADNAAKDAEAILEARLSRLETAAGKALASFESLRDALIEADDGMRSVAGRIAQSNDEAIKATQTTQRVADAAAESAARNAANIGMFANRAAEEARRAAESAIDVSRGESGRVADAAIEFTMRESQRITDAAAKALASVRQATQSAVEGAANEAERAAGAANLVSDAARQAMMAAQGASDEVKKAGDFARTSAEEAVRIAEAASERVAQRNKELADARAALEAENLRLETLIDEQRKRADRLAEAIATQTERLSKLAESQLREQEAAARLAEAQVELQRRAAAEELKKQDDARAAARRAEEKRVAEHAERQRAEETARAQKQAPAAEEPPAVLNLGKMRDMRAEKPQPAPRPNVDKTKLDQAAESIARGRPEQTRDAQRRDTKDARRKEGVSWREILTATDDAEPLDLAARKDAAASDAMKSIGRLQDFTVALEQRLYGDPPPALVERYERGDRNIFANRLLRLNESDVKRRVRAEASRDKGFERAVHDFLQGFEKLLEDATTSATADEELEQYLSSPLGRVYLLIGATVGYFA